MAYDYNISLSRANIWINEKSNGITVNIYRVSLNKILHHYFFGQYNWSLNVLSWKAQCYGVFCASAPCTLYHIRQQRVRILRKPLTKSKQAAYHLNQYCWVQWEGWWRLYTAQVDISVGKDPCRLYVPVQTQALQHSLPNINIIQVYVSHCLKPNKVKILATF